MKRRMLAFLVVLGAMIGIAALAQPKKQTLLVLEWAAKAADETPPVALLIEMGQKDTEATQWSGKATVTGARIVHREGYRFRGADKLVEPNSWEASSHRGMRVPQGQPQVVRNEGIHTVGVVLHLAEVTPQTELHLEMTSKRPATKADYKYDVDLKGLLSGQKKLFEDGQFLVRRISAATPVVTGKTEDDFPAAAYGPDGTLWVAYISYTLKNEANRIEHKAYRKQPENFKELYNPEFGDQLFVKYYRNGKWSEPIALTGPKEDLVRCAMAVDKDGAAHVVYSANRNGRHDLFARTVSLNDLTGVGKKEHQLTGLIAKDKASYLSPVMCAYGSGQVALLFQSWSPGLGAGLGMLLLRNGKWEPVDILPGYLNKNNYCWYPTIAEGPNGTVTAGCDACQYDVDYDLFLKSVGTENMVRLKTPVSDKFEARPSVAADTFGRLWIAYEEGPELWGKDYGALAPGKGNPLYNERSVRVVCLDDGKLLKPVAELPTSKYEAPRIPFEPLKTQQFEKGTRYAYPKIGIDGKGRIWVTYRQKFGSRYSTHPGSYWLSFARRLDGDHWSEPIELHHSDGLLDHRPVLLPHKSGGLLVIHNTDGRYTTPEHLDNDIYMSIVDLPGEPVEPKLVPHDPGKKNPEIVKRMQEEAEAVKRIRAYRVEAGGQKLQLLRGEYHRHTEISWDGGPDGSLEDMFRYAIDSAQMDWIGNGDHDNGAGREYTWWLTQKFTDAYTVKNQFTGMFTSERSVSYPHGHRNCMFAKRGVMTLPRLAEPVQEKRVGGVHADDTRMLYRYLHELDGICAVHTSATSMGTDWRDNDPVVEPIVEIYQGDRMSYEQEEAPRAGYDPKTGKEPANVAGWFPLGFVNHAFEKGYRLGFQASSDHWSTHISYFIVLAERNDRDAILAAVKKRHVYGATDDIILDVQSGGHVMGDEFKTGAAPKLDINVVGTALIARIDVLKDSAVVESIKPGKSDYRGAWTDPKPEAGTHYYYVRVVQENGELAWGSPMWITTEK
jgi:hypothetical protein